MSEFFAFLLGLFANVFAMDIAEWLFILADRITRSAARRTDCGRLEEEWSADLGTLKGPFGRLIRSLAFFIASMKIAPPITRASLSSAVQGRAGKFFAVIAINTIGATAALAFDYFLYWSLSDGGKDPFIVYVSFAVAISAVLCFAISIPYDLGLIDIRHLPIAAKIRRGLDMFWR